MKQLKECSSKKTAQTIFKKGNSKGGKLKRVSSEDEVRAFMQESMLPFTLA
jgi:hypothetical protein